MKQIIETTVKAMIAMGQLEGVNCTIKEHKIFGGYSVYLNGITINMKVTPYGMIDEEILVPLYRGSAGEIGNMIRLQLVALQIVKTVKVNYNKQVYEQATEPME